MSSNRFITIDVETANSWFGSICQVGVVEFTDGQISNEWETLVDPNDDFDGFNMRIHGITPEMVIGQPAFSDAFARVTSLASQNLVASYGHFDRSAFSQACELHQISRMDNPWLNIHPVVRRAWPDMYSDGGFGLKPVCKYLGIDLSRHHNAIDDARAAGLILLKAAEATGISPTEWIARNKRPVRLPGAPIINTDGPLAGENIAFTGALEMPRQHAQDLAASIGCALSNTVTKKTTILVVGDQDLSRFAGKEKSSKHIKAEALIAGGQYLRIIGESDFAAMVALDVADQG